MRQHFFHSFCGYKLHWWLDLTLSWCEAKMSVLKHWSEISILFLPLLLSFTCDSVVTFFSNLRTFSAVRFPVAVWCLHTVCCIGWFILGVFYSSTPVLILTGRYQNYWLTWTPGWSTHVAYFNAYDGVEFCFCVILCYSVLLQCDAMIVHTSQIPLCAKFWRQSLKLHDKLPYSKIFITRIYMFLCMWNCVLCGFRVLKRELVL